MEQRQDYIATLCAVATVGIAATGFALGTLDTDTFVVNPGKRKAPGADVIRPATISHVPPRRTISQPSVPFTQPENPPPPAKAPSLLRRRTIQDTDRSSNRESVGTQSRGSSHSRLSSFHRPWTANRDSSTERKDSRPGSSWLKRISTMSSFSNSSFTPSVSQNDRASPSSTPSTSTNALDLPNKLLKKSSSRRIASASGSQPSLLRRPMTGHHRSATVAEIHLHDSEVLAIRSDQSRSPTSPSFRPFFDTTPPRKRHTSAGQSEPSLRTISATFGQKPTLVLGPSVQPLDQTLELIQTSSDRHVSNPPPNVRQRLRRSLGSVHRNTKPRNFTEPIVHVTKQEVHGSILPVNKDSSLSPLSNISTFDIQFSQGTPSFTSSPPFLPSTPARFMIHKRSSVAPSDPTTTSSDNDGRVFTDDDSMDFQSDTAYDSLATRATASSHGGFRPPKVDTIFDDTNSAITAPDSLESMMKHTTLSDSDSDIMNRSTTKSRSGIVGFGIDGLDNISEVSPNKDLSKSSTPERAPYVDVEELMATPVPRNKSHIHEFGSSPPVMLQHLYHENPATLLQFDPDAMDLDETDEAIDWSPDLPQSQPTALDKDLDIRKVSSASKHSVSFDVEEPSSDRLSSIFDWSEPSNNLGNELGTGISPRPLTGHGRYGSNLPRSRPAGRRPGGAMHLRSQSVPVSRDTLTNADIPNSAAKFGTWNLGLGHKRVSEEWSDDFEFEESIEANINMANTVVPQDSLRSVKIPQTIIDRQASVHLQFGQVQEFMLLVEELKRLRARGTALGLIDGHSPQLWDDAESIVNLATMDEEVDYNLRPSSPTSSDVFGDETPPSKTALSETPIRSTEKAHPSPNYRSVSNSATPSNGRPRSGSLVQTKNFLQSIHQSRGGLGSSPAGRPSLQRDKLPFDTQDLRELVLRAGIVTKALKEVVRQAEGVSASPTKTPQRTGDPSFQQIFDPPDVQSCSPFHRPSLPNSRSANSFLGGRGDRTSDDDISTMLSFAAVVEAN